MYVVIRDRVRQQVKSALIVLGLLLVMVTVGIKLITWMEEVGFLINSLHEDKPSGNYMRVEESMED